MYLFRRKAQVHSSFQVQDTTKTHTQYNRSLHQVLLLFIALWGPFTLNALYFHNVYMNWVVNTIQTLVGAGR